MGVAMKSVSREATGSGPGGVAAAWGRCCPLTSACVSSPSVPANESSEVESWRECRAEESIELLCREWAGARVEPGAGSREGWTLFCGGLRETQNILCPAQGRLALPHQAVECSCCVHIPTPY